MLKQLINLFLNMFVTTNKGNAVDIFNDIALPLTLVFEGSKFTNLSDDKGGPTKYGVTQKAYDAYLQSKSLASISVANIIMEQVQDIYFSNYWTPAKCAQMTQNLAVVVFDTTVNSGQGRAIKTIQQIIGAKVDGIIGQETIQKLANFDQNKLANDFLSSRQAFYKAIVEKDASQNMFLDGWLRRVRFVSDFVNGVKTLQQIKETW
jgi:lysozyme family protein